MGRYSLDKDNQKQYKQKEEAWKREAREAYHTGNEELSDYIAKDIEGTTAKPIAKVSGSGIMDLTSSELGALTQYKSFESYLLNEALRNADSLDNLSDAQQKLVKELDVALSKMPKYKGDLLRTVDFSDWPDADKRTEKFLEAYIPGKTIEIKQYWSTSKTSGYNENAPIKIYIQDSRKGRDISSIGLDENEVLYERDVVLNVISKVFQDGVWHILVKEV